MTTKQLKLAIKQEKTLWWNDPDPIEGNDYTISYIQVFNDETSLIQYNEGGSEAEVFNWEIILKK